MAARLVIFNPWDERVARDIEAADKRRAAEIAAGMRREEAATKEPEAPPVPAEPKEKVSRAAKAENVQRLACSVCGGVTPTIRNDGISMPRHLPFVAGKKLYRGTEFCDGQGREGVPPAQ